MSARCPLCSDASEVLASHEVSVTSESKTLPAPSCLHVCVSCGHLFTTIDVDFGAYYAQSYDSTLTDDGMDEIVSTTDGRIRYRTDVDYDLFRGKLLRDRAPDINVLEFGAGRGRILSRLAKSGFTNLSAYELGTRYEGPLGAIVGADRVHIGTPPKGREFDVIASFFVLEHDVDPRASLAYMRSVSALGGDLYLMVPSYRTNAIDLACADHVHHFSGAGLAALVEAAGFAVVEIDETSSIGALVVVAKNRGGAASPLKAHSDAKADSLAAASDYLAMKERISQLGTSLRPGGRLYLYGAGFYATLASAALGGRPVDGVFDANQKKQGSLRFGHPVRDPAAIARENFGDASLVVCVNGTIAGTIKARFEPYFLQVTCL